MKRKYKRLIPFGDRLIRPTSLGDRLIRLAPFGERLIRPTSLRNRLIRSALFGDRIFRSTPLIYRRSSERGFNRVLPVLGGVGIGGLMMALLDPLARGRRRTRITPFGYWRRSRQGIGFDRILPVLGGVGLGGIVMALLEPLAGEKRRARMHDRTGFASQAFSAFRKEDVPDDELVGRVRSRLSRLVSRPHAIEVYADQGRVTLAGAVLSHELERLLKHVSKVPGVRSVNNRLEFHRRSEDISSLEDGRGLAGTRFDLMQADWSPARRLLSTLGGSALLAYGIRRGDWAGAALGTVGAGLCARGATNRGLKRLVGIGRGRHAVDFQKTINIKAPVNVVYDFWTNLENFPRFMSRVREVVNRGNGVSHWVMEGPGGMPVECDAVITKYIPNRVLAWKSLPGTGIESAGHIRFASNPDDSTRVDMHLSYKPPMGAIGHAAAELFGADPERQMDADIMRMKNLIEGANPPHHAAERMYFGSVDRPLWH